MKIKGSLEDISDGKLYDLNDMVKADTRGCEGCSDCCHGVGSTIVLNPFDMYEMTRCSDKSYDELLGEKIELHNEEKITLPHLKTHGADEACGFLTTEGRCSIHGSRPSICRLFPLGRYYEDQDFKYIFQPGECIKPNLSKVKVKKWIGIENYNENKKFILTWYNLLKALKWRVKFIHNDQELDEVRDYLIQQFFKIDWHVEPNFYEAFYSRLSIAKDKLGIL
jgi:Fe-S-cluster containining protein